MGASAVNKTLANILKWSAVVAFPALAVISAYFRDYAHPLSAAAGLGMRATDEIQRAGAAGVWLFWAAFALLLPLKWRAFALVGIFAGSLATVDSFSFGFHGRERNYVQKDPNTATILPTGRWGATRLERTYALVEEETYRASEILLRIHEPNGYRMRRLEMGQSPEEVLSHTRRRD